jgi:hypothetical protein
MPSRPGCPSVAEEERVGTEELLEALRELKVSDLLVQTLSTVSSLAYHRLSPEHRDLEQARLAIEGVRALLPILEELDAEQMRPVRDALSQLQMAYAQLARSEGAEPPGGTGAEPGGGPPPREPSRGPAKPGDTGGLWVPPGTKT